MVTVEPILVPAPHPASLDPETLLSGCRVGKGRSGGPGGQNRNKVETLVELEHLATGVTAHAGERRSAVENRRVAIFRLRLALAVRCRGPVPLGPIGSALWASRRSARTGRVACNPEHADYPAILAEALDVIHAAGLDVKRAAIRLSCTPSQLIKLVKDHPPALAWLNAARRARGGHALR